MRPLHRPRSRPGPRPDAPARSGRRVAARRCALLGLALFAWAAGGEPGSGQLREGERIGYGQLARLQPHLPPELWAHREVLWHVVRMDLFQSAKHFFRSFADRFDRATPLLVALDLPVPSIDAGNRSVNLDAGGQSLVDQGRRNLFRLVGAINGRH